MKKFFECLKKHVRRIVNFKNCKMKLLTNKLQESYEMAIFFYILGEMFEDKYAKDKNIAKK